MTPLPGLHTDQVRFEVNDRTLVLDGFRSGSVPTESQPQVFKFRRILHAPEPVREEVVHALYTEDTLFLVFPKASG